MISINKKKCSHSKEIKTLDSFNKDAGQKDDYDVTCRACRKEYRSENKEFIKKLRQEWYVKNKESVSNYQKSKQNEFREKAMEKFGAKCLICEKELFKKKSDFIIHHTNGINDIPWNHTVRHPEDWEHCCLLCQRCHAALHYFNKIPMNRRNIFRQLIEKLEGRK